MKSLSLKHHGALVTGSTKGIGAGIADGFEEAGARVIRHGRENTGNVSEPCLLCDLLEPDAVTRLMSRAFAAVPDLDLLVCNAGSFFDLPFLEMDRERWQRTFQLNVETPYFLIQEFARRLVASQRPGSVVIIGSTNGIQAEEDSTAYDVSKGALAMMTKTLATALAPHHIRVNCVAPGLIRTPLTAPWMDAKPQKVQHYEHNILLGRIGTPEDCAGACVFLCSEAAAYVTGQTLFVDGGLTAVQIGKEAL